MDTERVKKGEDAEWLEIHKKMNDREEHTHREAKAQKIQEQLSEDSRNTHDTNDYQPMQIKRISSAVSSTLRKFL